MKFYVAGRFSEKEKVKEINTLIKSKGHSLSGDWTDNIGSDNYEKTKDRSRKYAFEDLSGVIQCDVFILLLSEKGGTGSSTELGAAIALNKKIYAVGKHIGNNMFNFHPLVNHRLTLEEVLNEFEK